MLAGWRWVYFADPDGYPLELVENAYDRPGGHAEGIARYLETTASKRKDRVSHARPALPRRPRAGRGQGRRAGLARPGEVLLQPVMCGICGTDLHEYTDGPIVTPARPHPLTGAELPQILGHEFSAVVAAAGPGVSHVRAGDLCTVMPLISLRALP